jgi:hypothetical protein
MKKSAALAYGPGGELPLMIFGIKISENRRSSGCSYAKRGGRNRLKIQRDLALKDHSLKIMVAESAVIPAGLHTAVLETSIRSRMGMGRFARAFQQAPCRRDLTSFHVLHAFPMDSRVGACSLVQKEYCPSFIFLFRIILSS